jgi:hypothetical protein
MRSYFGQCRELRHLEDDRVTDSRLERKKDNLFVSAERNSEPADERMGHGQKYYL